MYYLAALTLLLTASNAASQLIELSYTYDNYTPTHPVHRNSRFTLTELLRGPWGALKWVESNQICSSEHVGTHIDAPIHFFKGSKTIDQIPYSKLYRIAGIKVNVTSKTCKNPDYVITPSDMESWIGEHGDLPDGVVVLFETGWGKMGLNEDAYSGVDENGTLHFPGMGKEVADWLVDYKNRTGQIRGVLGVGIDTLSFDVGVSKGFPAHLSILGVEKYAIENMMNLDKLPARNFTLTMFPMKVGGGSGGPTRIVAEIGGEPYWKGIN